MFSQPIVCPVLVGRDDALAGLRHLLDGAPERGRVVLISGEAGVGKSRLLGELVAFARGQGYAVWSARCFEQDAAVPYAAIGRLLAEMVAAGGETVRALAPLARDMQPLSTELSDLVAAPPDQAVPEVESDRENGRIADATARLVRSIAAERPTLIVIEDMHWADSATLHALLQVAREDAPNSLLVLTYRSDEIAQELEGFLASLDHERVAVELKLQRLGLAGVDEMIRAIVGGHRATRADFLHTVYQLTDGNPFFVEEVMRSFLDQTGSLETLNSPQLVDFDAPRSVRDAVRRRTQGLSPEALRVLSLAAVVGIRFDFSLLVDLTGLTEDLLPPLLKELIAAQILVEEQEDVFSFRHALTREAIHSDLLARERRALSRQIGKALERLHANELEGHVEDLARHFYEAGEAEKAFVYSCKAGERAMSLYAPAAAKGHLTRALELGLRLGKSDLGSVFRERGAANEAVGDFEAARQDYERAIATAEANRESRLQLQALLDLGLLWASRDYSRSEPYYRTALDLARREGQPEAIARCLGRLGNWYSNVGDLASARRLNEEALQTFRDIGDNSGVAQTLDLLGMTCYMDLQMQAGATYYREAVQVLEQIDDRRTLASTLASLPIGSSTYQTGMLPPAISLPDAAAYGERGLELARRSGWRSAEAYALWQLGFCLGPQGEYARALACANEALLISREIDHSQWEIGAECALGALLTDLLSPEAARSHLDNAISLSEHMAAALWTRQATALLVDCLLAAGEIEAARRLCQSSPVSAPGSFGERQLFTSSAEVALASEDFERALQMLDQFEGEAERSVPGGEALRLMRLRGRALAAAGQTDAAISLLRLALAEAVRQQQLSYAWRLNADLAHLLLRNGDLSSANSSALDALETLDLLAPRVPDESLRTQFITRAVAHLPATLRRRPEREHVEALTAREADIAVQVARGLTNREIAEHFVLSTRTVETHVANAMARLGLSNRSQLAAWAVEHGLLSTAT